MLYLKDINNDILASVEGLPEIATLLNDPEILKYTDHRELGIYLSAHHMRTTIYDIDFRYVGPNMDNNNMTCIIVYKQLCPKVE